MLIKNKSIITPIKDFKQEHKRLLKVLYNVNIERNKQQKELIELNNKLKKGIRK